jgi:hypothetical protein
MNMSLHELDSEIAQIEARIAAERIALDDAISGCTNNLRDTVASPKTLLALAGIGFTMGKLMFGRKRPQPAATPAVKTAGAGLLGLLTGVAGTALSMMQSRGMSSVARWAAQRYFAQRAAARATSAPARTSNAAQPAGSAVPPTRVPAASSTRPSSFR